MSRLAIIGGTGELGMGLAARLAYAHQVTIGSRDAAKAQDAATEVGRLSGRVVGGNTNEAAAAGCEIAIITVPDVPSDEFLLSLKPNLMGKLVISPIAPMMKDGRSWFPALKSGSAAEKVASVLETRVAAAFHTVPAPRLLAMDQKLDYDVFVTASSREIYNETAAIVSSIEGLKPLFGGGLRSSRMFEALAPALRNVGRLNDLPTPSIKVV